MWTLTNKPLKYRLQTFHDYSLFLIQIKLLDINFNDWFVILNISPDVSFSSNFTFIWFVLIFFVCVPFYRLWRIITCKTITSTWFISKIISFPWVLAFWHFWLNGLMVHHEVQRPLSSPARLLLTFISLLWILYPLLDKRAPPLTAL